jgi:hypothetical protein
MSQGLFLSFAFKGGPVQDGPPFIFYLSDPYIIREESKMSEFVFNDGRKAEKVENTVDPMTKVIEVYVEPKPEKKLAQRIIERFCVCEREIETIDELTGEVVGRVVEKVCDGQALPTRRSEAVADVFEQVEKRVAEKKSMWTYLLVAAVVIQVAVLAYFAFYS